MFWKRKKEKVLMEVLRLNLLIMNILIIHKKGIIQPLQNYNYLNYGGLENKSVKTLVIKQKDIGFPRFWDGDYCFKLDLGKNNPHA